MMLTELQINHCSRKIIIHTIVKSYFIFSFLFIIWTIYYYCIILLYVHFFFFFATSTMSLITYTICKIYIDVVECESGCEVVN